MRRRVAAPVSERAARNDRFAHLAAAAKGFTAFRPASEVLTRVRAVPTILPQFDLATRVGGLPIERFSLVHGPSGGGKTYFTIALLLSFLMRDHFAILIDAERTTPITWMEIAMGEYARHPFFFADKPQSYEATVAKVRNAVLQIKKLRDDKKVHEDTTAVLVVDSIRKLVPKDQFDRIMKQTKADSEEKVKDRSAQIKALMNAAWLDELIPLLDETMTSMVVISRETEDPDAKPIRGKFGQTIKPIKVGGGKALYYDASMNMRVQRVKSYGKKVSSPSGDKLVPYGDVHRVDITKSKVSGKGEEYNASCEFHISNGVWVPAGFDRARDLLTIARAFEVVEGTGWLKYGKWKVQSEDKAVKRLAEDAELFASIESDVRAEIAKKVDHA